MNNENRKLYKNNKNIGVNENCCINKNYKI